MLLVDKETKQTPLQMDKAIQRGIELLNENVPDWRTKINSKVLVMSSFGECILGQLYSNYSVGLKKLNIKYGYDYGFDAYDCDLLQKKWLDVLKTKEA